MRRIGDDKETLKLLEQGAAAAGNNSELVKRITQAEQNLQKLADHFTEQFGLMRYSLGNVFKTLSTYPAVKDQVENNDYRSLALARVLASKFDNFDAEVEAAAEAIKLETFEEMSAQDDANRKLTAADGEEIADNHIITISSKCKSANGLDIFRSKMDVGGPELADTKDSFLGKKTGDTVDVTIQGQEHSVFIHSTKAKPNESTAN